MKRLLKDKSRFTVITLLFCIFILFYFCTIVYSAFSSTMNIDGGSSYIGNSKLTNKYMSCYECTTSTVESTKTISTTNVSGEATSGYAKSGNGYAKITLLKLK